MSHYLTYVLIPKTTYDAEPGQPSGPENRDGRKVIESELARIVEGGSPEHYVALPESYTKIFLKRIFRKTMDLRKGATCCNN